MVVVFIKSSPRMAGDLRGERSFRKDEVVALHVASPNASIIQTETLKLIVFFRKSLH